MANLAVPIGNEPMSEAALLHLCGPELQLHLRPVTNAQYRLCVGLAVAATLGWGLLSLCAIFLTSDPRGLAPSGPDWETLSVPTSPRFDNTSLAANQSDATDSADDGAETTETSPMMCWFSVAAHHYRCECAGCKWFCRLRPVWRFRPVRCVWTSLWAAPGIKEYWRCYEQSLLAAQFTTITCPTHTLCSQVEDRCTVTVHAAGLMRAFCLIMCGASATATLLVFFGVGTLRKGTKIS